MFEMAKRPHNDSSQMEELLQPDRHHEESQNGKQEPERGLISKKQSSRSPPSSPPPFPSSSSSSSGPSSTGAVSRGHAEGDKPVSTQREDAAPSTLLLKDMKRLKLEPGTDLNTKDSLSQGGCSSSFIPPSSSGPSSTGAVSRGRAEGDKPVSTQREDAPPSTLLLKAPEQLPQEPEKDLSSKESLSQGACSTSFSSPSSSGPSSTRAVSRGRAEGDKPVSTQREDAPSSLLLLKAPEQLPQEPEKDLSSKESLSQGACSTSFSSPSSSSSSGPSSTGAVSRGHAERDEQAVTLWEDAPLSSCWQLKDLKRLPQCHKLKPVELSSTHAVLIDVAVFKCGADLIPYEGRDVWHSNFVKMPCSQESLTTKTGYLKSAQVSRWGLISKELKDLKKKTSVSVDDVKKAIIKCNPKYKDQWSFDALSTFDRRVQKRENYLSSLFPKIAALALKLPEYVKQAIPLLQRGKAASITLSQVQISCLLANAFFCTFPHRNATHPKAEYHNYPSINFTSLFGNWSKRKNEKLRAIMHYFNVVTSEKTQPRGLVTFERRCLKDTDIRHWKSCKETMPKLHVTSRGAIETEGTGMLQVDFASSWVGGGVLGSGLVQEEILFLINPELIVSRLFTERLDDNECLIITGSQQFSCYSGYSDSFEWTGPYEDSLERDEWARLNRQTLAIDALHFKQRWEQYNMKAVTRELNKAYCGFKGHGPDIATGKWGCGAFNGDPQLKAVIQLMAAARAKRGLAFFTFEDVNLMQGLQQVYHLLVTELITVEKLYRLLEDFCDAKRRSQVDLFEFIKKTIRPSKSLL